MTQVYWAIPLGTTDSLLQPGTRINKAVSKLLSTTLSSIGISETFTVPEFKIFQMTQTEHRPIDMEEIEKVQFSSKSPLNDSNEKKKNANNTTIDTSLIGTLKTNAISQKYSETNESPGQEQTISFRNLNKVSYSSDVTKQTRKKKIRDHFPTSLPTTVRSERSSLCIITPLINFDIAEIRRWATALVAQNNQISELTTVIQQLLKVSAIEKPQLQTPSEESSRVQIKESLKPPEGVYVPSHSVAHCPGLPHGSPPYYSPASHCSSPAPQSSSVSLSPRKPTLKSVLVSDSSYRQIPIVPPLALKRLIPMVQPLGSPPNVTGPTSGTPSFLSSPGFPAIVKVPMTERSKGHTGGRSVDMRAALTLSSARQAVPLHPLSIPDSVRCPFITTQASRRRTVSSDSRKIQAQCLENQLSVDHERSKNSVIGFSGYSVRVVPSAPLWVAGSSEGLMRELPTSSLSSSASIGNVISPKQDVTSSNNIQTNCANPEAWTMWHRVQPRNEHFSSQDIPEIACNLQSYVEQTPRSAKLEKICNVKEYSHFSGKRIDQRNIEKHDVVQNDLPKGHRISRTGSTKSSQLFETAVQTRQRSCSVVLTPVIHQPSCTEKACYTAEPANFPTMLHSLPSQKRTLHFTSPYPSLSLCHQEEGAIAQSQSTHCSTSPNNLYRQRRSSRSKIASIRPSSNQISLRCDSESTQPCQMAEQLVGTKPQMVSWFDCPQSANAVSSVSSSSRGSSISSNNPWHPNQNPSMTMANGVALLRPTLPKFSYLYGRVDYSKSLSEFKNKLPSVNFKVQEKAEVRPKTFDVTPLHPSASNYSFLKWRNGTNTSTVFEAEETRGKLARLTSQQCSEKKQRNLLSSKYGQSPRLPQRHQALVIPGKQSHTKTLTSHVPPSQTSQTSKSSISNNNILPNLIGSYRPASQLTLYRGELHQPQSFTADKQELYSSQPTVTARINDKQMSIRFVQNKAPQHFFCLQSSVKQHCHLSQDSRQNLIEHPWAIPTTMDNKRVNSSITIMAHQHSWPSTNTPQLFRSLTRDNCGFSGNLRTVCPQRFETPPSRNNQENSASPGSQNSPLPRPGALSIHLKPDVLKNITIKAPAQNPRRRKTKPNPAAQNMHNVDCWFEHDN